MKSARARGTELGARATTCPMRDARRKTQALSGYNFHCAVLGILKKSLSAWDRRSQFANRKSSRADRQLIVGFGTLMQTKTSWDFQVVQVPPGHFPRTVRGTEHWWLWSDHNPIQ